MALSPFRAALLLAAICTTLIAIPFVVNSNVGPAFAAMKSDRQLADTHLAR